MSERRSTPGRSRAFRLPLLAALVLSTVTGCRTLGPDYQRPGTAISEHWRQADPSVRSRWKIATPQELPAGDRWWTLFGDPTLNTLVDAIEPSNQNIAAAEAQYRQALALLAQARASLLPSLSGNAAATRSQVSRATGSSTTSTTTGAATSSSGRGPSTLHDAGVSASWEVDLWGRIARTVESNQASAQASAADLAAARLSARAALAQAFFQLRVAERRSELLTETVIATRRALTIADNRYQAGVAPRADVIQAQSQLASVEAQLIGVRIPRAQLEHAIALLLGRAPVDFTLPAGKLAAPPENIPLALPSTLLERRPDIAAAERRVAAANAQIGVAAAAFFPTLTLSGSAGYRATDLSDWLTAPARFWSLGPALALTLFDAGRRQGVIDQNEAIYDQRVAQYRQTVLSALVEVEDNLVALRVLSDEAAAQQQAVTLARQAFEVTLNQYRAGLVSFNNVVTAQTQLLSAELTALGVTGRQFDSSVILIRALGGGWSTAGLPVEYPPAGSINTAPRPGR
jgi:NodT family efflux transporter outer membrane factor (OMF) lipoprotein